MLLAPEATLADGRYKLHEARGVGGMATVWLAEDTRLARSVAIKVIAEGLALEPHYVLRFQREARMAARLSHPNLVRIFDFGSEDGRPYLVSEWIDGPDLQELRREGAAVEPRRLATELLGALRHIHAEGIVHRDVKPSNVLLDPEGRCRLTDFGIAQPEDATRLTQTGMVMGTAPFVAPEILLGDAASPRSDLYSVGRLLDYLHEEQMPSALRRLAARLCAEDPGLRPASADEALELIRGAAPPRLLPPDAFEPAEPPAAPAPGPPPRPGTARLRTAVAAAIGLTGAAIAAVAIAAGGGDGGGGDGGGRQSAPATAGGEPAPPAGAAQEAGDGAAAEPAAYTIPEPKPKPDPAKGAALNQRGYELIQAGAAEKAVKPLEHAVREFPAQSTDLNYAYALFNLGQALRISGRAAEAVVVLEQRLEIPDQTDVVAQELALARRQAGGS